MDYEERLEETDGQAEARRCVGTQASCVPNDGWTGEVGARVSNRAYQSYSKYGLIPVETSPTLPSSTGSVERGVFGWYQADLPMDGDYTPDVGRTPMVGGESTLVNENAAWWVSGFRVIGTPAS